MSFTVDELLEAALTSPGRFEPKDGAGEEQSQYSKLAEALETSAKMNAELPDPERFPQVGHGRNSGRRLTILKPSATSRNYLP